ncbi:hypothetical protein G9A89_006147 [Geosiphon pyriformis]|nr:hypothetical protein G9A89_006147 [Geosiphon pyriformis]
MSPKSLFLTPNHPFWWSEPLELLELKLATALKPARKKRMDNTNTLSKTIFESKTGVRETEATKEGAGEDHFKTAKQLLKPKISAEVGERVPPKLETPRGEKLEPDLKQAPPEKLASETTWAQNLPPKTAGQEIRTSFFLYNLVSQKQTSSEAIFLYDLLDNSSTNMSKYDKSKPFLLDYEAVVGPSIAVMKQTVKSFGSEGGFKAVLSRKKRRGSVLEDNAGAEKGFARVHSGHSWGSETGDITESNSVDMEEECLVEETSFDYGEGGALVGGDLDQMPKGSQLTTRKALGKPLGKIDFLDDNDNDDVLLDASLVLPPPLKNLVNVLVRKSFALDLDLKAVEENLAQEKLKKIRSLFSGINGFGRASIPSKFLGIIRVTFTSKSDLMKATEKATGANIMVNTDLKRSSE